MQDYMLLELPDGSQWKTEENIQRTNAQETQFLFSGLQQPLAILEELTGDDVADSLKKQIAIGFGAGRHTFRIEFEKSELDPGDSETWGDAAPDDSAASKMDQLDHRLDTVKITSEDPATLSIGEYSDSGKYAPQEVVIPNSDLTIDHRERASTHQGTLEFLTTQALDDVISAEGMTG